MLIQNVWAIKCWRCISKFHDYTVNNMECGTESGAPHAGFLETKATRYLDA